jgi:hypothetical protein
MVRQIVFILLIIGVILMAGCSQCCVDSEKGGCMSEKTIEQVQQEHTSQWMATPGVEGTAIGLYKGKPCIKIFSSVKPQKLRGKIPTSVEGYPVIIEETGTFRALERQ